MLELINKVNEKLKNILEELQSEIDILTTDLQNVQEKIDSKIDEAKGYKISVDEYKENINNIENEIKSLEKDLNDLKENYGNKGLDAIVDVGTKEINSKIMTKQLEVSKQAQKINELTDRARTIKELLINLKKDKKEKKEKLDSLTITLEYYKQEFDKIIEYSNNNSDSLVYIPSKEVELNYEVPVIDDKIEDSPVFDEIASMDKEEKAQEEQENSKELEVQVEEEVEPQEVEVTEEEEQTIIPEPEITFDDSVFNIPEFSVEKDEEIPVDEVINQDIKNIEDTELTEEESHIDDTISSLFAKDLDKNIDFKALSESIDKEYENIFGTPEPQETNYEIDDNLFMGNDNTNVFDKYSFLDQDIKLTEAPVEQEIQANENTKPNYDKGSNNDDIVVNFFLTNKLDFNEFNEENRQYIKNIFNPIGFTKILDILKKHNIAFFGIYENPRIFEMDSSELDSILTKLLISGQTTHDISLIINSLPSISLMDLNEAINSYGQSINNASITDIIIKAKHLNDLGGTDK